MDGFTASSAKRTGRTVTWQHTHPTIVHVSDLYEYNARPRGGPRGQLVRAHGDRILATSERDLAYHARGPDGLNAPPQSRLTRRDCVFQGGATFSHLLIVNKLRMRAETSMNLIFVRNIYACEGQGLV
jgi:hypothetical protein